MKLTRWEKQRMYDHALRTYLDYARHHAIRELEGDELKTMQRWQRLAKKIEASK